MKTVFQDLLLMTLNLKFFKLYFRKRQQKKSLALNYDCEVILKGKPSISTSELEKIVETIKNHNHYDLYLNRNLLVLYANKQLKGFPIINNFIEKEIDEDEFLGDIIEGIEIEQTIQYEESREAFLKQARLEFQKKWDKENSTSKKSTSNILEEPNFSIIGVMNNLLSKSILIIENLLIPAHLLNNKSSDYQFQKYVCKRLNLNSALFFFMFILYSCSLVFITINPNSITINNTQSSLPIPIDSNKPLMAKVNGFFNPPLIEKMPFIKKETNFDLDTPFSKVDEPIKTVATKAIINGYNSPPIVVAKEEKEGISLLYTGNDVAVITAPPVTKKRINESPLSITAKKIKKEEAALASAVPPHKSVKLISLRHAPLAEQPQVDDYFLRFALEAVTQMKQYDVPASVLLGTAAVLSNWGKLEEAIYTNNHFMIACNIDLDKQRIVTEATDIAAEVEGYCIQAFLVPELSYQKFGELIAATKIIDLKQNQKILTVDGWLDFFKAKGIIQEAETLAKIREVISSYHLEDFDTAIAPSILKVLKKNNQDNKEILVQKTHNFQQNYQLWSFVNSIFMQKNAPENLMSYVINEDKKEEIIWDNLTDFRHQFANCKTPLRALKDVFKTNKEAWNDYEGTVAKHLTAHRKACEESGDLQLVLFSKPSILNKNKKDYNVGAIKDETMFLARLQNPPKLALNK